MACSQRNLHCSEWKIKFTRTLAAVNENPYGLPEKFISASSSRLEISIDNLNHNSKRHYYNDQLNNEDLFRDVFLNDKYYQSHAN